MNKLLIVPSITVEELIKSERGAEGEAESGRGAVEANKVKEEK